MTVSIFVDLLAVPPVFVSGLVWAVARWRSLGRARADTLADAAAAGGDLVVVSIPPRAYPAVPEKPLAGKPLLTRPPGGGRWWCRCPGTR